MSGKKQKANYPKDRTFLFLSLILMAAGLMILSSASVAISEKNFGNPFHYLIRQVIFGGGAGLLALFLSRVFPLSLLRGLSAIIFYISLALVWAVFLPGIGVSAGGASRWLSAGGFTVQPSELLKITLPLYLAAWLSSSYYKKEKQGKPPADLMPFLFILGLVAVPLILQPDISTLFIILATGVALYILSGRPLRAIGAIGALMLGSAALLVKIAPYRLQRLSSFLNPGQDPLGAGYHVQQALLAIGSGGIFGRGLGFSREKLFFLPEPMGDAVFSVFAEEAGFVGAALLVVLFIILIWRGLFIARRLPDPFTRYFAAGLIIWIGIQAFLNIAGNIALAPLVGVTLPLISYGATSFAVTIASLGLIYKMSAFVNLKE